MNKSNMDRPDGTQTPPFTSQAVLSGPGITFGLFGHPSCDIPQRTPKRTSKVKILLALTVIFLIAALVFAALYTYEKLKVKPKPLEICLKKSCVEVSSGILNAMNQSIDPCDDFYEYACGGWIKNNPIPDARSAWSQFHMLYIRNEELMKQLINDKDVRRKYSNNEALTKAYDFYDACMNLKQIEILGAQPLLDLIKNSGSWNVTNKNWTESNWNFMKTFVKIHKDLSIAPLFNMFVSTDLKDSTKNVIVFDQSGIGISREAFLFNTTYQKKIRKSYKKLMTGLMKLLGAGDEAEARMEEVYNFEETLAKNFIPKEQRTDFNAIYKKMSLGTLINETGNNINLTEFLEEVFKENQYKITPDEKVVVYALGYMKNVSVIFAQTPRRIIANYMMWHVARRFARYLSKEFRELFYQYSEETRGTRGEIPRWQDCTSGLDSAFGMAIGVMFIENRFSVESKRSADQMIHDIRKVFIDNLKYLDWMDEHTQKVAKEKAEGIRENIGYPEYIVNSMLLAAEYKGFEVNKTRNFHNEYNKKKFFNLKNYMELGKPVDKTKWYMTPATVNAYYSFSGNKIVFPAGILQYPFYDGDRPKSLNYGGIGMVVGHEITHGFDDNGRKFNKEGNLKKWWTNSSIAAFKKKTQCLIDQYKSYTFHGKNVNGKQTLGENIADNGGLKQAFQAYQRWKRKHGEQPRLPGLDLNHDQLFYLSFAQMWCSSYRPSAAYNAVQYGVHSPASIRVIGPLSNSEGFAKAYSCPVGSRMNPEKKCAVW